MKRTVAPSLLCALLAAVALGVSPARSQPRLTIPPENDPARSSPAARPPLGDLDARVQALFAAILDDAPARVVADLFFPLEPFVALKGISAPERYHATLVRHFEEDVHALHAELAPVHAQFARFELSRRWTWQTVRSEGNTLPYWSVRHSRVHYTVARPGGGRPREAFFELRTLIHWGPRWYVTHLR